MRTAAVELDRSVPALVLKIGQNPLHSGPVGAMRSLGRCGVPAYAITEPGLTPVKASRYRAGHFVWRATGREDPGELAADLAEAGRQIGRKSVIVAMDDESAVLVAEHADLLAAHFLFPAVPVGLPRRLASKSGLAEVCRAHGVATPTSLLPETADELSLIAATASFPVMVKNASTWDRHRNPVGASVGASSSGAKVVRDAAELLRLVLRDGQPPGVLVQEYIPPECAEDWIVQAYCDANCDPLVMFTGRRTRSWPPRAGMTSCGLSVSRPELADMTARLCKQVGFSGIADLDWRLDLRDGQFKLLDFNPRCGNQFRMFQTSSGVDAVRALHLDLTGRQVPPSPQLEHKRIVVEHTDLPARLAYRRLGKLAPSQPDASLAGLPRPASTELAWLAADDPLPALAVLARPVSIAKIVRRGRVGARQRRAGHATVVAFEPSIGQDGQPAELGGVR